MKYIRKKENTLEIAPDSLEKNNLMILGYNKESNEKMLFEDGYIKYTGYLPLSCLDIVDNVIVETPIALTLQDYDDAIENRLYEERVARGYTVREPSAYINSSNAKWAQDAKDWNDYIDEIMNYGLSIQTEYYANGSIPDIEDFKATFPQITWSYSESGEGN